MKFLLTSHDYKLGELCATEGATHNRIWRRESSHIIGERSFSDNREMQQA